MINNITKVANFFKILSDPTRLRIIDILLTKGRVCVSDLAKEIDMSNSSVSHQLSRLELNGIVKCEREGQTICYEIIDNNLIKKLRAQVKSAS